MALLRRRGYRVLTRNHRCRGGEVDVVAREAGELVFVEVRARRHGAVVSAEESIGRAKRQNFMGCLPEIAADPLRHTSAAFDSERRHGAIPIGSIG